MELNGIILNVKILNARIVGKMWINFINANAAEFVVIVAGNVKKRTGIDIIIKAFATKSEN